MMLDKKMNKIEHFYIHISFDTRKFEIRPISKKKKKKIFF